MTDAHRVAALGVAASLFLAAGAAAQAVPDARDVATARALFESGVELADSAEWEDAVDHFTRAQQLHDAPPIALNLGLALLRLNRLVEASEQFRRVIRAEDASARHRRQAAAQLDRALPRLGTLHVEVDGIEEEDEVALDDDVLSTALWGAPIPVDPGAHHVSVQRRGATIAEERFELAEGQSTTVSLSVPPSVAPSPTEVAEGALPDDGPEPAGRLDLASASDPPPDGAGSDDGWVWGLAIGAGAAVVIGVVIAVAVVASSGADPSLQCSELSLGCVDVGR